jgi:hypothetical protein
MFWDTIGTLPDVTARIYLKRLHVDLANVRGDERQIEEPECFRDATLRCAKDCEQIGRGPSDYESWPLDTDLCKHRPARVHVYPAKAILSRVIESHPSCAVHMERWQLIVCELADGAYSPHLC